MKGTRTIALWACGFILFNLLVREMAADVQAAAEEFGPYHGVFIPDGLGLRKTFNPQNAPLTAAASWSLYCWVRSEEPVPARTLLAGFGEPDAAPGQQRYLAVLDGRFAFWAGADTVVSAEGLQPVNWHMLTATYDGAQLHLYKNGTEVASKTIQLQAADAVLHLAPHKTALPDGAHFAGRIAHATLIPRALTVSEIQRLLPQAIPLDVLPFEAGSRSWTVSGSGILGMRAPQSPATLPKSSAPPAKPVAVPICVTGPTLVPRGGHRWALAANWCLAEAARIAADGPELSKPGFKMVGWLDAVVPGTALTTFIERGIYPDPDYGLNNLAIPDTLNKQDYWYRTEFTPLLTLKGRHLTLTFEGINYQARIWLNGRHLGDIKGAFTRGVFDVTGLVVPGQKNALAVLVSPPPHPGIPHEQSMKAGAGLNGGVLCLDGPTFICTEGWDWLPGIRDRNTGIWQEVTLSATGQARIGDIQVVSALPLPDHSRAEVSMTIPLRNDTRTAISGMLEASFEGVKVVRRVTLRPGETIVRFAPAEFPQLVVANPRLWWPNGYGDPALYHLRVAFAGAEGESDVRILRFGIRLITYELTLLDRSGRLRRVEYSPTSARGNPVVDVRHEAAVETRAGYVYSFAPGTEASSAVRALDDWRASPFLILRVNGVRIACKGGNWGIDDSRKRVSREQLEPYVRLHREAHFTMIRNWCGQSTEEAFYELCDEYGLLVWNDFWITTQDSNLDPSDTALFLANAHDTLLRYRNHPSIALWCGRNEGVPSPALNEGLDELIRGLDGTRLYLPNSRLINLAPSGPWNHGEAVDFFTTRALGFSTELGLPSPPTIESFQAMMPPADLWPPNDTWAYHDWHFDGGGNIEPFMESMDRHLGAPSSLDDFVRKAQMMNYANHRAMFEGFNARLWAPNSGRLLWMSQPAWPSMSWQLFSHDYDTHGTFYGVKKACEPVHVQLNLPDLNVMVVNNKTTPLKGLSLEASVFDLNAKLLSLKARTISIDANSTAEGFALDLPKEVTAGVLFVKLELRDTRHNRLSENFYWHSDQPVAYRKLNELAQVDVTGTAQLIRAKESARIQVDLANGSNSIALMTKLTLRRVDGGGIVLPAYFSDNYISLLPGEGRRLEIECPADSIRGRLEVGLQGWNVRPAAIACMEKSHSESLPGWSNAKK